jgi:heat shock protein HslJ
MRRGGRIPAAMMLAALLIGGGCRGMGTDDATPAIADSRWLAEDIDGRGIVDQAQSTIEFQGTERIAGSTGCNRYFAQVTLIGDNISVGQIASTRRACPPALMDQEQRFTQALAAARRYALDGPYLLLFDAAGAQRLRLVRYTGPG